MQKLLTYLFASSTVVSAILCTSSGVLAEEIPANNQLQTNTNSQQLNINNQQDVISDVISQVTSVSQLSDVQPNDWAFQALQSLVERYGCVAGYPNSAYRGNRALSRYEFAAGLNACLDRVNELIATATADLTTKEDLATIQKLQNEFSAELATLKGRVDVLEAKTADLEANQFSTTTKLQGQVVAVVSGVVSGNTVSGSNITSKNTTLGARTRLELVTSFTGKDTLFTRLESNNINNFDLNTTEGRLSFATGAPSGNVSIGALSYGFPLSENTYANIIANDGIILDLDTPLSLFDGNGGSGAVSAFGTRNPIYAQLGGAGLGIKQNFGKNLTLSLGYLASGHNTPTPGNGLFDGPYGGLAQLTVKPSDRVSLRLTYINSYNRSLSTGSNNATFTRLAAGTNFSSNSYGVEASLGITKQLVLGGWVGYTNSQVLTGTQGKAEIWNYAVTLGLPDFGKKGNLAGIVFGMEPKVTNSSVTGVTKDSNTSYHVEGFYQYKVSDNITITPAVIWLTAPNHDDRSDSVVMGALRTTFSF